MENFIEEFLSSNLTLSKFCKENNLNKTEISKQLENLGYVITPARSGVKTKLYKLALDDYLENTYSQGVSAKKFNVSGQTLKSDLLLLGLYDESRNNIRQKAYNESVFDCIDTEEKAYWLGFIFADGYIYDIKPRKDSNRLDYNFELCASDQDFTHMQKFANFIGYNKPLKITKADNNGHKRCRVCLSSKHLWNTLNNYGCTPKKSLTLMFPNKAIFTKEELVFDFIRGYLDGDGWITYNGEKAMSFGLLGTENFLKSIQKYLSISYKLHHNHENPEETTMRFTIGGKPGLNCLHKLYKNANVYLDRKYKRYLEYCRLYE